MSKSNRGGLTGRRSGGSTKIKKGRSLTWNRPLSWVGDTGIEPVTSSV